MKRFLLNTVLILLPLVIAFTAFPVDKRYRYTGLKEDCFNHGIWVYDRVHLNSQPMDLVFIGSSHTVNGINDKLIENCLKNKNIHAVNLGYCRLGRNLSYTLIKELLHSKQPRAIVIEVLEDEDRYSHPIFPYIAETADVFAPPLLFNRDILADMRESIYYKLTIIQKYFSSTLEHVSVSSDEFGFASSPDTASAKTLSEVDKRRSLPEPSMCVAERNFYMKYPRTYLHKIGELCSTRNIKLYFLYLPGYGSHMQLPKENATYVKYGEVLIPPDSISRNTFYWKDEDHLNQAGATSLSKWICGEMENRMN